MKSYLRSSKTRCLLGIVIALAILLALNSCGSDSVSGSGNQPPIADAGSAQEVELGSQVFLNGSRSSDPAGRSLFYRWLQLSGPPVTLSDSTSNFPSFIAPRSAPVLLTFELTVNNGQSSAKDATMVLVTASTGNEPPTANAGADQTVVVNSIVTLYGSGSDRRGGPVQFQWNQTSGPNVTLNDLTASRPTFTAPGAPGLLAFALTVTDEGSRTTTDSTTVVVEAAPVTPVATLHVVNSNPAVSGFLDPALKDGNEAPERYLFGATARLELATDVVVDANNAIIVCGRAGQIVSFDANNQMGDGPPNRIVEGADTGLQALTALAIGRAGDILFAVDQFHNVIFVYDRVSKTDFNGPIEPSRVFWTQDVPISSTGASYDEARDHLYIVDTYTRQILVYHDVSRADGATRIARTIQHSSSSVEFTDVYVDGTNDRLYATDGKFGAVYVWDSASTRDATNAGEPSRTIEVGESLQSIVVDSQNRGYIADWSGAIYSYDDIHMLDGAVTPNRTITGEGTQLDRPQALSISSP